MPPVGRCETCAAFTRVRETPEGKVGHCLLEVFPPPVPARATCSRHREKGAPPPPPPKRVPGEPRGNRSGTPGARRSDPEPAAPARAPLPKEIDLDMDTDEFRRVLREVLRDELGAPDVDLGGRWQGGEIVLKPGREGTAEKRIPLETFFHKIVMLRDKLRVLEQKINANEKLTDEEKVQLQQYVTGCYGTLTTFNVLFANRADGFSGSGGED